MRKFLIVLFYLFTALPASTLAQDTLPAVKVKNINGRIIISWKNTYGINISNINIQRSFDSLKNFSTIGTVLSPQNRENGFADVKPPYNRMYYRVFVAFEGGSYVYSKSYRPVKDTAKATGGKDTVVLTEPPVIKPAGFVASKRVYTGKDNNVVISLPEAPQKKYLVKFFDEADNLIFEVTKIPEPYLVLEKVNFMHAGWFFFEVYENGALIEKHKFYISKDGKAAVQGEQGKKGR
jgi:hypothetical protein